MKPIGYSGARTKYGVQVWRQIDRNRGEVLLPNCSWKLQNHSPDGFGWGYEGSGPAQLALAILLDFTHNPELALRLYQSFKRDVVAMFAHESWELPAEQLETWIESNALNI